MPKRYGTRVLKAAAALYARSGRGTEFICETSTQKTRLQKAIRQHVGRVFHGETLGFFTGSGRDEK